MVVTIIHVIRRVAVIKQSLCFTALAPNMIRWPHGVAWEGKQARYVCVKKKTKKNICSPWPISTYQLYMTQFAHIGSAHMMPNWGEI